jgi:S-adenosylmethionine synthetase
MNKVELHCKKKILSISYVTSTKRVASLTLAIQTTQYIKNKVINTLFGKNFELHPSDAINKL